MAANRRSRPRVGEASILGDLANSLSASLTDVMRWVYWWHTVVPDPSDVGEEMVCVKLNTDFETAHLNGQELSALVSAWQAGAISRDTLLHNLRQGEILPPGRSREEEERLISDQLSVISNQTRELKNVNFEPQRRGDAEPEQDK